MCKYLPSPEPGAPRPNPSCASEEGLPVMIMGKVTDVNKSAMMKEIKIMMLVLLLIMMMVMQLIVMMLLMMAVMRRTWVFFICKI